MISFIIRTCYDRRGCLERAIKSVLLQKNVDIEILLIENGSHKLREWAYDFTLSSRQTLSYFHQIEADRCAAGNLGLEMSRGELICFLDDDDEIYENFCKEMSKPFTKDPTIDAVCGKALEIQTSIASYTPFKFTEYDQHIEYNEAFSRELLWIRNFLPIQSVLFRRALFVQHGGFDLELSVLEDWEMWVRYSSNNKFVSIPDVTSFYRVPYENEKRIDREAAFRDHYFKAIEKQKNNSTRVDKASYSTIIRELLVSYRSLNLLFQLKLLNYEKLCTTELEKYSQVQQELTETNPRDAIECAKQQLLKNKAIRFLSLSEHRIKTKIQSLIAAIRSTVKVLKTK